MSSISDVPLEIMYNILLRMSYKDILNYCKMNREANMLCNDDLFWMNKLDIDFGYVPDDLWVRLHKDFISIVNGKSVLTPSKYVKAFSHPDKRGRNIYKRWNNYIQGITISDAKYLKDKGSIDYLVFNSARVGLEEISILELIKFAILHDNITLLKHIKEELSVDFMDTDIEFAEMMGHNMIADWIKANIGHFPESDMESGIESDQEI